MKTLLLFTVFAVSFKSALLHKASFNLKYGSDLFQCMDVYEPKNVATKAILLIHGGFWGAGEKEDLNIYLSYYFQQYPTYLIANMNFRLGNPLSPGYPKQLYDIEKAISFLRSRNKKELSIALLGASSGGHIAMLYGYKMNKDNAVKVIIDFVGPADFTDKNYANSPITNLFLMFFVGPYFYKQNPGLYNVTSPVAWITPSAPKTIGFYAKNDILIPNTQEQILRNKLDKNNVTNEFHLYPGSHVDWIFLHHKDWQQKVAAFLNKYF